ncbi:hypothetical protein NOF04DRAFT_11323 [Fusarium oxysporum II5]|uniref:Ribonuclease H1 N-terminal domain-containing protein n=3 Tax=Fusarium oxysporum species complex TaxID=171631 RepID=N1S6M4_FUSC4|nr:uncharacterized protein FOIG_12585 [Fusarium odoratissimum NRRL 54006]EMT73754.1 hypothetical protein FOC4_g10002780 [Fusarium odoratissimum]EXL94739.1 hypothetical protein FOIG_12585 [Fusarium odoratissimum NRRL 54006]KAK2128821.1 hypothetical protein NOF04DRAFT_11323 [Fusarium oxysporum II5]TXC06455.1 hypothetical protein FocTR4_00010714 [Fusarium oxysporum f. sp. cubense]
MAKFYAIARGFKAGIAHDEDTRKILTNNYKDNSNQSFKTRVEAEEWLDKKLGVQHGDWPDIYEEDAIAARHAADTKKAARNAESTAASQAAAVYRAEERRRAIAEATLRGKEAVLAPALNRFSQPTSTSYSSLPFLRRPVSLAAFRDELLEALSNVCDRYGLRAPATTKLRLPAPEPSAASRRAGTVNTLPSSPQDKRPRVNESVVERKYQAPRSPKPSFLKPEDTHKGRSAQRRSPFQPVDSPHGKWGSKKTSFRGSIQPARAASSHKSAISDDEDEASSNPFSSDSEASEDSPPRSQRSRKASHVSSKPTADTSSSKSSNRRFQEPNSAFSDSITQKKPGRAEPRSRTAPSRSQPTPSPHLKGDDSRAKRDKPARSPPATFDMASVKRRRLETIDDLFSTANGISTPRKSSVRKASRTESVRDMPPSNKAKQRPRNIKKGVSSKRKPHSDSEYYEGPISIPSDTDSDSDSGRSPSPMHSKRKTYDNPDSSTPSSEPEKSDSDASDSSDASISLTSRRSKRSK